MKRGNYYKEKYGNKRQKNSSDQNHGRNSISRSPRDLTEHLSRLNNQSYGSYKQLLDHIYTLPKYTLVFEKIQGDPYAPPSRLRICVNKDVARFPKEYYSTTDRRIALADYLARQLHVQISKLGLDYKSSGSFSSLKGGNLEIAKPGQKILDRTSVIVYEGQIEARFTYGLTARGRTVVTDPVMHMFNKVIPQLIGSALEFPALAQQSIQSHLICYEDQQWLRKELATHDLIALVPDGAILPRESGVSDRPLSSSNRVAFKSPLSLQWSFNCPSGKVLTGMGIRKGIVMIAGGGYHGKSTLLESLEQGIYNHIPGDGREYLVCNETLSKVRSEDGRNIEGTDVSPYIDNLPFEMDTKRFSTQDASGSTSMAAGIQEMVEMGAEALLYDEDTCATNFMIRDQRMQLIIHKGNEPITPLISKIRALYMEKGVSSVLVIGGCGDYIDVADCIIEMRNYLPIDITEFAKSIAARYPSNAHQEGGTYEDPKYMASTERLMEQIGTTYGNIAQRKLSIPAYTKGKTKVPEKHKILFDHQELDLSALTSIAEMGQTSWMASAISYLCQNGNTASLSLKNALGLLDQAMDLKPDFDSNDMIRSPLDFIDPSQINGDYTRPTILQLAQAINRLRGTRSI